MLFNAPRQPCTCDASEKADNEWSRSQGKSADSEITQSSHRKLKKKKKKKKISNAIVQLNEETTYKQSYVDEMTMVCA